MNVRRIRLAIGVLAASALLSACGLVSLLYPPVDFTDLNPSGGPFSSNMIPTTLRHGTATIKITSGEPRVVELPHLSALSPGMVMPGLGAIVSWTGGDWELQMFGSGLMGLGSTSTDLTILREDTEPALQADATSCAITFTSMTPAHVAGHAECKGLVWEDAFGSGGMDLPRPSTSASPGIARPPFDATITFDATP